MDEESGEAPRASITASIETALRQQARRSAHPADEAALRRAAAQIVRSLQAGFFIRPRHSLTAELPCRHKVREHAHE